MPVNFENTEVAFRPKSDAALRRSYWLFRLLQHPWLVKLGTSVVRLFLRLRFPIQGIIKRTIFQQFCGGETIGECQGTIQSLGEFRIGTILDYSVEGMKSEKGLEQTTEEILRTIDRAAANPLIPFCVFKVTGIARFALLAKVNENETLTGVEPAEWDRVLGRMSRLCGRAFESRVRIFVDAEETWIQDAIDRLAELMMERFNRDAAIVFNTLQMYRTDRLAFLEKSLRSAREKKYFLGLKLVRGAYMEKERARAEELGRPSPILPDKASTDKDYDEAVRFCMGNLDRISLCAGTHNEASCQLLVSLMEEKGLARHDPRVTFSQLLGMSDHLSYNLADQGFNVAKYVPYGPVRAVMPYLFRRAEENTSVAGQTGRELTLLTREWVRRKTKTLPSGRTSRVV